MKDPTIKEPKKPKESKADLLSASIALRPLSRLGKRKRRRIGGIGGGSLKTLPRPPGLIQRILWEAIRVVVEGLNPKKTLARSPVTIITKRATMQPSARSHPRQKTSIGLGDLRVGD